MYDIKLTSLWTTIEFKFLLSIQFKMHFHAIPCLSRLQLDLFFPFLTLEFEIDLVSRHTFCGSIVLTKVKENFCPIIKTLNVLLCCKCSTNIYIIVKYINGRTSHSSNSTRHLSHKFKHVKHSKQQFLCHLICCTNLDM